MLRRCERAKDIKSLVRGCSGSQCKAGGNPDSPILVAQVDYLEDSDFYKLPGNNTKIVAELSQETTNDDDNDDVILRGTVETNTVSFEPIEESDNTDSKDGNDNSHHSIQLQYSLDDLIGTGGFSNCYIASDVYDPSKKYALKILKENSLKAKLSCKNEFNIHTSFKHHPHIVKCFGMIQNSAHFGLVLELCSEKKNLKDLISCKKFLTIGEIYYYLPQIIDAVAFLHENLIIHRDLKLTNILIDSSLQIKVADFGLAIQLKTVNDKCKHSVGTPSYAAPEMIKAKDGDGYSFSVDVWAIGIMMYVLLFGTVPFQGHNTDATFRQICLCKITFPFVPIHDFTKDLIKRLLHPKSIERPIAANIMKEPFFSNPID